MHFVQPSQKSMKMYKEQNALFVFHRVKKAAMIITDVVLAAFKTI
jgi:hypothetical protein